MTTIETAKQRWAQLHAFDLEDSTWEELFASYNAGDVLEALRRTSGTRSPNPEVVYNSLLYKLDILHTQRQNRAAQ
jgi:hypothetical protein